MSDVINRIFIFSSIGGRTAITITITNANPPTNTQVTGCSWTPTGRGRNIGEPHIPPRTRPLRHQCSLGNRRNAPYVCIFLSLHQGTKKYLIRGRTGRAKPQVWEQPRHWRALCTCPPPRTSETSPSPRCPLQRRASVPAQFLALFKRVPGYFQLRLLGR